MAEYGHIFIHLTDSLHCTTYTIQYFVHMVVLCSATNNFGLSTQYNKNVNGFVYLQLSLIECRHRHQQECDLFCEDDISAQRDWSEVLHFIYSRQMADFSFKQIAMRDTEHDL